MSLTSTMADQPTRAASPARNQRFGLDLLFFIACAAIAVALAAEGGAEAMIGAAGGGAIGALRAPWRNTRFAQALSGAFAGLFIGALFAGFFHAAIVAAFFS